MISFKNFLLIAAICFFSIQSALAQEAPTTPAQTDKNSARGQIPLTPIPNQGPKTKKHEFSIGFEVEGGPGRFPGFFLGLGGSIVKHPKHLDGWMKAISLHYSLTEKTDLALSIYEIRCKGLGEWAKDDTAKQLAEAGVTGNITGLTEMRIAGFDIIYGHAFGHRHLAPYVRAGGGIAYFNVDFRGRFIGEDLTYHQPINADASDKVQRRTISILGEGGMQYHRGHVTGRIGGFLRNGFIGLKLGVRVNF